MAQKKTEAQNPPNKVEAKIYLRKAKIVKKNATIIPYQGHAIFLVRESECAYFDYDHNNQLLI